MIIGACYIHNDYKNNLIKVYDQYGHLLNNIKYKKNINYKNLLDNLAQKMRPKFIIIKNINKKKYIYYYANNSDIMLKTKYSGNATSLDEFINECKIGNNFNYLDIDWINNNTLLFYENTEKHQSCTIL